MIFIITRFPFLDLFTLKKLFQTLLLCFSYDANSLCKACLFFISLVCQNKSVISDIKFNQYMYRHNI